MPVLSKNPNFYMYISVAAVTGMLIGWAAAKLVDWIAKSTKASEANHEYANTLAVSGLDSDRPASACWPIVVVMTVAFALCGWN